MGVPDSCRYSVPTEGAIIFGLIPLELRSVLALSAHVIPATPELAGTIDKAVVNAITCRSVASGPW